MLGIRLTDPIRTLIGAPVATVPPTATLRDAATTLAADGVGLLVAVDPRGVRGVLSERDVVTAVAEGVDLDDARVRDHVTADLVALDADATLLAAAAAMSAAEVRHLTVTEHGEVVGVLSIRDVVDVLLEELAVESPS